MYLKISNTDTIEVKIYRIRLQ